MMLLALTVFRDRNKLSFSKRNLGAVLALCAYIIGVSQAYLSLNAGLGTLLLCGGLQVAMFTGALLQRETLTRRKWIGAALAFSGIVYLLSPSSSGIDPVGAGVMIVAGIGWGIYSIIGKAAKDPLYETAMNFLYAVPVVLLWLLLVPDTIHITARGITLAIIAGAVTSGLGYALWYAITPHLQTSTAAVTQLTVPIIVAAGGSMVLSEPIGLRFVIAAVLVLGGLGIAAYQREPKRS